MARSCLLAAVCLMSLYILTGCGGELVSISSHLKSKSQDSVKGTGQVATDTRKVGSYHAIRLTLPATLNIELGSDANLSVEADSNIVPLITTEVKDGELFISCSKSLNTSSPITITAKTQKLDHLNVDGAADCSVKGLSEGSFELSSNGASKIQLSGKLDKLKASLNGAGSLQAKELSCKTAGVSITGAGEAQVNASDDLDATITGAGSISYKGNPKVKQTIAGVGTVNKL